MTEEYAYVLGGATFQHREAVKELGFVWDVGHKVWVRRLIDNDLRMHHRLLADLKKLPGVSVSEQFVNRFKVLERYCRF